MWQQLLDWLNWDALWQGLLVACLVGLLLRWRNEPPPSDGIPRSPP